MVSNDPACAKRTHISASFTPIPMPATTPSAAKPVQRHIGASHRFAKPVLDRVDAMGPDVNVVDQQQVQPVSTKPQQRLFHRTHGAVIGIVDHCPVRLPTDKTGTVASPVKRVHPAADLGADHNVLARHAPDRSAATMFGKAIAIERGSVE